MELRDYVTILRDRWILAVACALTGMLAAGLLTLTVAPIYTATSQIYVSVQTQDGSTQNLAQGSTFSQSQVVGFADLATSPLVLEPVISDLGLDRSVGELGEMIEADVRLNTSLIDVTVRSTDSDEAASLSNQVSASMVRVLPELQRPLDSALSPIRITVTRFAEVPDAASSPNPPINLAIGFVVGCAVGVGAAILRKVLDTRIRSEADLTTVTDKAILGAVPFDASTPEDPLAILSKPLGQRAEAIRRLRTNLQFINASSRPRSIVVTSSLPGEGKSTTAVNLALAMTDAGAKVILIDGDLRRPTLAKVLGIEGAVGLTTVLIGRAESNDVVQPYRDTKLDIMTAGEVPPNPSELLGSAQMHDLIARLENDYDMVVIDSAPLLPVTDGAVLAKLTDGALLVVGSDRSHRHQVSEALSALETVGARVLGLVMNRTQNSSRDSYNYYEYRPAEATPDQVQKKSTRTTRR